jgi:hypothetical protein
MAHKVYRVAILPPYGYHMMQREPHAPLGCHVHRMGTVCTTWELCAFLRTVWEPDANIWEWCHIGDACAIWGPYGAVCTIFEPCEPCAPDGSQMTL